MPFVWNAKRSLAGLAVVAAGVTLAACSSGHAKDNAAGPNPAPPTSPSANTAPATPGGSSTSDAGAASDPAEADSTFCTQWSAAKSDLETTGATSSLADARRSFANVVTDLKAVTNPPAAIRTDVQSMVFDIEKINVWLNTTATQADLTSSDIPSEVAAPFKDMDARSASVLTWVKSNCPNW